MPSPDSLHTLLSRAALLRLAGEITMDRGTRYRAEGRVAVIAQGADEVTAQVAGTHPYRVRLWDAGGTLGFDCTCPVGIDLRFCKHCVAVALELIGEQTTEPVGTAGPPARRSDPQREMRAHLERQDPAELVELLMEHAAHDARLRTRLRLRAAAQDPGAGRVKHFRSAVDRAFRTGGFVDYHQASGYAARILDVIGEMRALLESAPAELVALAEHAMAEGERAIQSVDDSDGHFTTIFEALADLHLEACLRARPDPVALAARLFKHTTRSEYDAFLGVEAYADVLGPPGMAAYRAQAEQVWATVPALAPGERDRHPQRFTITRVMESLAAATGGVEALVEVKRRDLSNPYQFLRIAEAYREAGDHRQATRWAEDGLAAFPHRPDGRLRAMLAAEYQRAGRRAEAMELMWSELTAGPGVASYDALKEHATLAGAWPEWRERALSHLRERAGKPARPVPAGDAWGGETGYSTIVRILLWEGSVDEAWLAAREGGCSEALWFELARKREGERPGDAIPIYQRRIEAEVASGSNPGYEQAVRLLARLRDLCVADEREPAEFADWTAGLRARHQRKRNFVKLLDAARLA